MGKNSVIKRAYYAVQSVVSVFAAFTLTGERLKPFWEPVWVDLFTGRVYAFPKACQAVGKAVFPAHFSGPFPDWRVSGIVPFVCDMSANEGASFDFACNAWDQFASFSVYFRSCGKWVGARFDVPWCGDGLLDFVNPMNYTHSPDERARLLAEIIAKTRAAKTKGFVVFTYEEWSKPEAVFDLLASNVLKTASADVA